jgi:hypothetical protein
MVKRDVVTMDIERDGVDLEVEVNVDGGEAHRAFVIRPRREVVLTCDEEKRAVEIWLGREEQRRDRHDADAFDRAGDR